MNVDVYMKEKKDIPIQKPIGDLKCLRVRDNRNDFLQLLLCQLPRTLLQIDFCLLTHHIGKTTAHTLDGCQGVLHGAGPVHVGVEDTEDVLELGGDD
jgi:hypothetical protein